MALQFQRHQVGLLGSCPLGASNSVFGSTQHVKIRQLPFPVAL